MVAFTSTLTFFIACSAVIIKVFSSNILSTETPNTSLCDQRSNQENYVEGASNVLDVRLAVESGSASFNLKSIINGEVISRQKSYGGNLSDTGDREGKSPVVARSANVDFEKSNFAAKLDYLSRELEIIEKTLTDLQAENKKASASVGPDSCLGTRTSIGVHYKSCNKPLKKQAQYPRNCKEVHKNGNNISGIYEILPTHSKARFFVLCDMETWGGGWTHIQKRFDGSQDFTLPWRDYKFGFGDLEGEFWLGLQNIYLLSGFEPTELLVEIVDRDNVSAYAHYKSFAIGPEPGGYKLDRLAGFSGDAGDSLTYNLGQKFSTKDLDFSENCVSKYPGGWWYKACHISTLNGKYINIDIPSKYVFQGIHWKTFRSHEYCHSKSRMLVRPAA